jgi:hypothetical protein
MTVPVKTSRELPKQLVVQDGVLVCRHTGKPARLDFPNGTEVNVMPHKAIARYLDDAFMFRNMGC